MSRKKTPDIFSELMNGNTATKQESNKTVEIDDTGIKEKSTFNLSINTLDKLDDTWMTLRKELRNRRITKTLIVERAIELLIEDFEDKGYESALYKDLS